jgi:hypothetical protein
MANYYTDHPEIEFHLDHPLMKRIVELKEKGYADKDQFADAPVCYEDAIENYKRVLDITGDVAANIIEPNSESVDLEGPHLVDGRMVYASKTVENIDATCKAGLWGVSMPRKYGGLNLPNVVFSMLSRTFGACRAASTRSMSLDRRSSDRSTSPASARALRCPWTSRSPTLVAICSALCSRPHRTRTARGV